LKAYGASDEKMRDFSSQNLILMPGAKEMLKFVRGFMPSYIVSTSYAQYMHALCVAVEFPFENVRCTRVDLDNYVVVSREEAEVKRLAERIVRLPMLKIPRGAGSLADLPKRMQDTVQRLDEIFWEEIPSMKIGRLVAEVNPVGGSEKAAEVKDIVTKLNRGLENVMYVGDSITDASAFQLVRGAGGLAVSFNGNNFAVREAEVAVLSRNAIVTAVLASIFSRFGKARLVTFIREWKPSTMEKAGLYEPLNECFTKTCSDEFPTIKLITGRNVAKLMQESTLFRKKVRGEAVGKLG